MHRKILTLFAILGVAALIGCSSGGMNPAAPVDYLDGSAGLHDSMSAPGHMLWGLYTFYIDTDALTVDAVPCRAVNPHINATSYVTPPACPDCISTEVLHWDSANRVMTIAVSLTNPVAVAGFDVRGILILNDAGHNLQYPDGWVTIWDDGTPPYFNPFMRYAKTDPDGKFPKLTTLTETFRLIVPMPMKLSQIKFAVDAFSPKNEDREPYAIINKQVNNFLFNDGTNSVTLTLTALDRNNDVDKVEVTCPSIFVGTKNMVEAAGKWSLTFVNENQAPAQIEPYILIIEAWDNDSPYILRDQFETYVIEHNPAWISNFGLVPAYGDFSADVACISGGLFDLGGFLVDSESEGTAFNAYDMFFIFPEQAFVLPDINPFNHTLQPYPPERFDSALGGGIAFSNSSEGKFEDGLTEVPTRQVVVSLDNTYVFKDNTLGDHQAHYPLYADTLGVADICDGFTDRLYTLWAETTGSSPPLIEAFESTYIKKHEVLWGLFPPELVGEGPGKIQNDASAIAGIDADEVEEAEPYENVRLYVLETNETGGEIEIFNLYTEDGSSTTVITHVSTIVLGQELGIPRDLELLRPNPDYLPNPDTTNIAVLFKVETGESMGGWVAIYDAESGEMVDQLGDALTPTLFENVRYLDVNDTTFSIIVVSRMDQAGEQAYWVFTQTYA